MAAEISPPRPTDETWSEVAAASAAEELVAGKLIRVDQADFAQRIIAQQLHILLISNYRPASDPDWITSD